MTYPTGSEREIDIQGARQSLFVAVMCLLTEHLKGPFTTHDTTDVDAAARALVEAIDAPETCFTCGQAKPC